MKPPTEPCAAYWRCNPFTRGSIVKTHYPQLTGAPEGDQPIPASLLSLRTDGSDGSWILLHQERQVATGTGAVPTVWEAVRMRAEWQRSGEGVAP